jgi:uncharacterized membrane protein YcaP (DUF421 family)
MDGQLTITELAVMITFGAIVSVPMQIPDRGILLGILAMLCLLIFERGVNWLAVKNEKIEAATQGTISILIKNGILQLAEMRRAGISKQNLFAALRSKEIFNLGSVKRLYFEGCGLINVYKDDAARPGLPILPPNELDFTRKRMQVEPTKIACSNCGNVTASGRQSFKCENCGEQNWMDAVY